MLSENSVSPGFPDRAGSCALCLNAAEAGNISGYLVKKTNNSKRHLGFIMTQDIPSFAASSPLSCSHFPADAAFCIKKLIHGILKVDPTH